MNQINKNSSQLMRGLLEELHNHEYVSVRSYMIAINKFYFTHTKQLMVAQSVIDRLPQENLHFNGTMEPFKRLQMLTKKWKPQIKNHVVDKIQGTFFEMTTQMKLGLESTDFETDYNGGVDLIDNENKTLFQVKCSNRLDIDTERIVSWANDNGYEDYDLVIIWYNKKDNKELVIPVTQEVHNEQ